MVSVRTGENDLVERGCRWFQSEQVKMTLLKEGVDGFSQNR